MPSLPLLIPSSLRRSTATTATATTSATAAAHATTAMSPMLRLFLRRLARNQSQPLHSLPAPSPSSGPLLASAFTLFPARRTCRRHQHLHTAILTASSVSQAQQRQDDDNDHHAVHTRPVAIVSFQQPAPLLHSQPQPQQPEPQPQPKPQPDGSMNDPLHDALGTESAHHARAWQKSTKLCDLDVRILEHLDAHNAGLAVVALWTARSVGTSRPTLDGKSQSPCIQLRTLLNLVDGILANNDTVYAESIMQWTMMHACPVATPVVVPLLFRIVTRLDAAPTTRTFLDYVHRNRLRLSPSNITSLALSLHWSGDLKLSHALLASLDQQTASNPTGVDPSAYKTLLGVYAKSNQFTLALRLVRRAVTAGVSIDRMPTSMLCQALVKAGRIDMLQHLADAFEAAPMPVASRFDAGLLGSIYAGLVASHLAQSPPCWKTVHRLARKISDRMLMATPELPATLLAALTLASAATSAVAETTATAADPIQQRHAAALLSMAEFQPMVSLTLKGMHTRSIPLPRPSYDVLIAILSSRPTLDADAAAAWLESMIAAGHTPSQPMLTRLISMYGRLGDLASAQDVFQALTTRFGYQPDAHAYAAILFACGQRDAIEEMNAYLERLLASGGALDVRIVETLVRAFVRLGDVSEALRLLEYVPHGAHGQGLGGKYGQQSGRAAAHVANTIHELRGAACAESARDDDSTSRGGRFGDLVPIAQWSRRRKVLQRHVGRGVASLERLLLTVVEGLARGGRFAEARRHAVFMTRLGLPVPARTVAVVIRQLAHAGRRDEIDLWMEALAELGCPVDESLLATAALAYVRCSAVSGGSSQQQRQDLDRVVRGMMAEHGITPQLDTTWMTFMAAFALAGDFVSARTLWTRAVCYSRRFSGVHPSIPPRLPKQQKPQKPQLQRPPRQLPDDQFVNGMLTGLVGSWLQHLSTAPLASDDSVRWTQWIADEAVVFLRSHQIMLDKETWNRMADLVQQQRGSSHKFVAVLENAVVLQGTLARQHRHSAHVQGEAGATSARIPLRYLHALFEALVADGDEVGLASFAAVVRRMNAMRPSQPLVDLLARLDATCIS
ncbi:hypothetical protein BC831DRAFT_547124 [Entophlyctis helioformis]|nr:hypothetical protein BC831DRAFT_547124 [Entophlyctis helioformis]